jgi:hypothetical protein
MKKIEFTQDYIKSLKTNREEALSNGDRYFYDDKSCRNGHEPIKLVKENRCFFCKRIETKLSAEKRRRRNGVIPQNKVIPPQQGVIYGKLIATGGFKIERSVNRKNNKNVRYHEVICSCGKKFWLNSYNWQTSEQCSKCSLKTMSENNIQHNESQTIIGQLYYSAKKRAIKSRIKFDIKIEDIIIPESCPVFNIELDNRIGVSKDRKPRQNAPSLDRINSNLGYIKKNVIIMSYKANVLKKDGTSDEHLKIAEFMEKMGVKSV